MPKPRSTSSLTLPLIALLACGCTPTHSAQTPAKDPPFTADTQYAAGQLAETQQDLRAALAHYQAALKIQPDHAPSLYRLGILETQLKHYPQAIEAWKSYVRATHGSATAYSNLGFCHDLAGQFDDAKKAYEKGLARDPNNATCRINYGLLLARHGRPAEATVQLRQALTEPQVHYNLASAYESTGHPDLARAEYTQALFLDPSFLDARLRLARLNARATTAPALVAP